MFEPLLSPLFSDLLSPLIDPAQRIFITLDAAQQGFFVIQNPVVETGDYEFNFDFVFSSMTLRLYGNASDFFGRVVINGNGSINFRADNSGDGGIDAAAGSVSFLGFNKLTVRRVGSVGTILINDSQVATGAVPTGTLTVSVMGRQGGNFTSGIIANPDFDNGNAWKLDRATGNTEQAANGNNELTLVNIPTGAPDRELFTKNTSTDPDQWENADKSRIIEIA